MKRIIPLLFAAFGLPSALVAQTVRYDSVGIGISYPSNRLHIAETSPAATGDITTYAVRIQQSSSAFGMGGDANYSAIQSFNSRPLLINPVGNNIILGRTSLTNVGIGNDKPLFPLHVMSATGGQGVWIHGTSALATDGGAFLRITNSGTPTASNQRIGGIIFGTSPNSADNLVFQTAAFMEVRAGGPWINNSSQPVIFRLVTQKNGSAAPEERLRVTEDGTMVFPGNTGVGTYDTKGYKFAVNGDAIFTKIKVKPNSAWPDYVFSDNYKLTDLTDLGLFIQKEKHLPEIPSAEEVEREGIDLGEMNKKLLQKVEELTLYLIKMNEQNKALKKEVDVLKEKIK